MTTLDQQEPQDTAAPATGESAPQLLIPTADDIATFAPLGQDHGGVSRRTVLRVGAAGAAVVALTSARVWGEPYLAQKGLLSTDGVFAAAATALTDLIYIEAFPTSPLIVAPFNDKLPIPPALKPIPQSEWS